MQDDEAVRRRSGLVKSSPRSTAPSWTSMVRQPLGATAAAGTWLGWKTTHDWSVRRRCSDHLLDRRRAADSTPDGVLEVANA